MRRPFSACKKNGQGLSTAMALLLVAACASQPKPHSPVPPPASFRVLTVAVLEFEDHGIGTRAATQGLGRTVADQIAEALVEQPGLRLVDRDSLQKVLEELSLSSQEIVNPETRLRLGKLLGAQYLIVGGFTSMGSGLRIDGRIVEVEKGLTVGTSVQGRVEDRRAVAQAFSKKIADKIAFKIAPSERAPTTSQDFLLVGFALERSNDDQKALEMYQQALSLNPKNSEARERMEALLLKELQ